MFSAKSKPYAIKKSRPALIPNPPTQPIPLIYPPQTQNYPREKSIFHREKNNYLKEKLKHLVKYQFKTQNNLKIFLPLKL